MTRILQCLVWISVMAASAHTQRGYTRSNLRSSIFFPSETSRSHESLPRHRRTDYLEPTLQGPRIERIQTRASESHRREGDGYSVAERLQLTKRGGHRKNFFTKLIVEIIAALGAQDQIVFPGPSSSSRLDFEPVVPEECKQLGYCEKIPNYPRDQVQQLIAQIGDEATTRFTVDELDANDIQIVQRLGGTGAGYQMSLCNATEKVIYPESLPDMKNRWYTVVQDKNRNMLQGFRTETCRPSSEKILPCDPKITVQRGFTAACEQKYVYRTVWVATGNDTMEQKTLRLPSCCSCILTALE